ncbi:hypothetical protein JD844_015078 [Phrynosoma platyrhinos]|uniref:Uncharacterized protein n=1 Tax=Phrynosoma platyrhinos TaxID=52577 RepID=A0ABQ7T7W1_PHRPL|nr:hypothetical protein JD844_015078 [Phrynosoma platyrhinos]
MQTALSRETAADQEVPREAVLPEPAPGEFDFNEFFNLDKSVPGLASMIEDVLGEGAVSASRFSRWFSNPSRSGSRSSLEQGVLSPGQNSGNYFAPIPLEDRPENKVDILEMLQKAKVDLKPLLSSLSANKEKLRESSESSPVYDLVRSQEVAHSGVVLSVEEVEAGLKGLKVDAEGKAAAPSMAERMEESLNATDSRHLKDGDMSAFNKLVSTMKASGTLPSQPKANALMVVFAPTPRILRPRGGDTETGGTASSHPDPEEREERSDLSERREGGTSNRATTPAFAKRGGRQEGAPPALEGFGSGGLRL